MDRSLFGEASELSVGKLKARCVKCKATRFARMRVEPGSYADVLVCVACETPTSRYELIDQLIKETMRKADEVLAANRRKK